MPHEIKREHLNTPVPSTNITRENRPKNTKNQPLKKNAGKPHQSKAKVASGKRVCFVFVLCLFCVYFAKTKTKRTQPQNHAYTRRVT